MTNGADKPTILIVDDIPDNIAVLSNILVDYNVKAATNGGQSFGDSITFQAGHYPA